MEYFRTCSKISSFNLDVTNQKKKKIMESLPPEIEKIKARVYPTLLKGLTEVCKEKPEDPVRFLAYWLMENNPYKPRSKEVQTPLETPRSP